MLFQTRTHTNTRDHSQTHNHDCHHEQQHHDYHQEQQHLTNSMRSSTSNLEMLTKTLTRYDGCYCRCARPTLSSFRGSFVFSDPSARTPHRSKHSCAASAPHRAEQSHAASASHHAEQTWASTSAFVQRCFSIYDLIIIPFFFVLL